MIIDTSIFYMELENNVALHISMVVGVVLVYKILMEWLRKGRKNDR